MKKVLAGFIMDGRGGGVDRYLLNFLENTASEEIQIDFLTNEIDVGLEEYLKGYHSRLYAIANLRHPFRQFRQVQKILKEGGYEIVYLNVSTAIDCVAAWAAKKSNIKRILVHSHSSGNDCENRAKRIVFNSIHYICRLFLHRAATEYYGCSKKAGEWLFPKRIVKSGRFQTVFNAVDIEQYTCQPQVREEVRKELHLEQSFVVGNVSGFTYQKNHYFLIEIFEELKKRCPEAVLLLVGTGERMEKVSALVREKKLEDSVKILGFRRDVSRLMQGMDYFLLPSYFEGLPTVSVEAQCTGLPCLMSAEITDEAKITQNCWFLSLKETPETWAEFILSHRTENREEISWIGTKENYGLNHLKRQQKEMLEKAEEQEV